MKTRKMKENLLKIACGFLALPASILVKLYLEYLKLKARRWKRLPSNFIRKVKRHYPGVNLADIRYSEDISSLFTNCAVTLGNTIYFPGKVDLLDSDDVHLMSHELCHSMQYKQSGGSMRFLFKYIVQAIGVSLQKRTFDVHDDIPLEIEADEKADQVIDFLYLKS